MKRLRRLALKFIGTNNYPVYGRHFNFAPFLPKNGKPGKYLPKRKRLVLCGSGWHCFALSELGLQSYIFDDRWVRLLVVEMRGKVVNDGTKMVCESMRFVEEVPWANTIRVGKASLRRRTEQIAAVMRRLQKGRR